MNRARGVQESRKFAFTALLRRIVRNLVGHPVQVTVLGVAAVVVEDLDGIGTVPDRPGAVARRQMQIGVHPSWRVVEDRLAIQCALSAVGVVQWRFAINRQRPAIGHRQHWCTTRDIEVDGLMRGHVMQCDLTRQEVETGSDYGNNTVLERPMEEGFGVQ